MCVEAKVGNSLGSRRFVCVLLLTTSLRLRLSVCPVDSVKFFVSSEIKRPRID